MVEYVDYQEPKGPKLYRFGKYSTSTEEIKHLVIALFLITLAIMALNKESFTKWGIGTFVMVYIISIGLGFLLHELGHKFVAQYYGYISEFRGDFMMMLASIAIAFFGFLFLAPGAVMIHGRLSLRENGIISVAGPIVNLVLAIIFILMFVLFSPVIGSFLWLLCIVGIQINALLGVFNMLPFWVLDGKKVLAWSRLVYFTVLIPLALLLILSLMGFFSNF